MGRSSGSHGESRVKSPSRIAWWIALGVGAFVAAALAKITFNWWTSL
jgi:hypothetical protein